ncbi:uncharacterized protein LOC127288892 [Leptopilina boulardi]|uniref:uncharacterized protein LOC127286362 n=1 Tax=Leptopilina boulardi TaxID=63433 RepID=UPI0021F50566|nr:uncharacterized protein LOC127286362 [Leptopilina boulardi]XP_051172544.1 uncharacterized protein LOC127288892 [Leptopilina boulardi]
MDHRQSLLALLEKVKGMRPARDQEKKERDPDEETSRHIERLAGCIRLHNTIGQIGGERGFLMEFGSWGRAPVRGDEEALWCLDPVLRNSSPKKRYSRCQWYQEYRWCESTRSYMCRGFWAVPFFADPTIVREAVGDFPILQGWWRPGRDKSIWKLRSLPPVPPQVGFQPLSSAFALSFLQCFYWTREGQARTRARWQLKIRVPVSRVWQEVGQEGYLLEPFM